LNKNDIAGTIQTADLIIKAGKFNITNKNSSTKKVVKGNSDVVTIFDGEITSKDGRVTVNDLYVNPVAHTLSLVSGDQITLTLYIDGSAYADDTISDITKGVTFSNLGEVEAGKSMKIEVKAQPNVSNNTGYVDFKVSAKGTDEQSNPTEASPVSAARLDITNAASMTIANSNATSTVEKAGSSAELVSFSSTVKDGNYNLTSLDFVFG
jgi:hypothetical protein